MTSSTDLPWTEEKETLLRELWKQGISGSKIAAELGCRSSGSVTGKARRLGLPKRKEGSHGSYVPTPSVEPKAKATPPRSKFNLFRSGTRSAASQCVPCPLPLPPPLTSDQKEYILGQGILLLDLKPDYCRWPINEPPRGGEYLFCGAKALSGCVYCGEHEQRSRGSGTPSERRATETA